MRSPLSSIGLDRPDQQHLVKFRAPGRCIGERVEKAPDQRARVLVVLRRQRPPLRHQPVRLQPGLAQLVEVPRVEVRDAGRRRRRRLEGDEIVALGSPQKLLPAVTDTDVQAGIGRRTEVPGEQAGGAHDGREQLGHDARVQTRVGEECAGGDAGPEAHDQRAPWLSAVNQQWQQRLKTHVALRRHRVAGIGDALNVEPTEVLADGSLLEHGDGPAAVLRVEDQGAAAPVGQQRRQPVARREPGDRDRQ